MTGSVKTTIICALVVLAGSSLFADTLTIDLAEQPVGTTETRPVAPGTHDLIVFNRMPDGNYVVNISVEHEEIPPLDYDTSRSNSRAAICEDTKGYVGSTLSAQPSEKKVKDAVSQIRLEVRGCSDAAQRLAADEISWLTTHTVDPTPSISQGQRLIVKIQRLEENGAAEATWTRIYTTGSPGAWTTSFGFNFIPNNDERYYTEVNQDEPGTFVIRREADRRELDFAPSVFFSWYPSARRGKSLYHGLVAGLGFDLSNPVVFLGYGATFRENITLTGGVVAQKQLRLAGRYEEGEVIGTNLDNDQLTEATYAANVYIGVAFRFGSNPFSDPSTVSGGQ